MYKSRQVQRYVKKNDRETNSPKRKELTRLHNGFRDPHFISYRSSSLLRRFFTFGIQYGRFPSAYCSFNCSKAKYGVASSLERFVRPLREQLPKLCWLCRIELKYNYVAYFFKAAPSASFQFFQDPFLLLMVLFFRNFNLGSIAWSKGKLSFQVGNFLTAKIVPATIVTRCKTGHLVYCPARSCKEECIW